MVGIDHVEILDQTGLLVFMVSRDDIVVHNDYINFTVRLCETDEMFSESETTAQIGDVISWSTESWNILLRLLL